MLSGFNLNFKEDYNEKKGDVLFNDEYFLPLWAGNTQ